MSMRKMASELQAKIARSKIPFTNYEEFKQLMISKIPWTEREWTMSTEKDSEMHKIIRSAKHWFNSMKETTMDTALVITLYNIQGRPVPTALDVVRHLKANVTLKDFIGYSLGRNKFYYVLSFANVEAKMAAMQALTMLGDSLVIAADWFTKAHVQNFYLTWLPVWIELDNINALLEPFMDISELKKITPALDEEENVLSGKITGKCIIKSNLKPDQIPHYVSVEGYPGLLTIVGRSPICFNCSEIGHISKNCDRPYCKSCKIKHRRDAQCEVQSYANALRRNAESEIEEIWSEQLQSYDSTNSQLDETEQPGETVNVYTEGQNSLEILSSRSETLVKDPTRDSAEPYFASDDDRVSIIIIQTSEHDPNLLDQQNSSESQESPQHVENTTMDVDQFSGKRKASLQIGCHLDLSKSDKEKKYKSHYGKVGTFAKEPSQAEMLFDNVT